MIEHNPRMPMRKRAPRPRRRVARRPRRRTAGAKSNTRVDQDVRYRTTQTFSTKASSSGVGQFAWSTFSPQNANHYNLSQVSEFNGQSLLYDEFCIKSVKISYRPFYNVLSVQDFVANSNINMYTFVDRDGNAPVSSSINVPQKLQAYDSCKIFKTTKAWSRTLRTKTFWSDTATASVNPRIGNLGTFQPWINAGLMQCMGVYAENVPVESAANIGELTYEVHVQFRGKKPASFGYDPVSGSVIVTPLTSYPYLAPQNPPTTLEIVEAADESLECGEHGLIITSNYDGQQALAPTGTSL